MWNSVECAVQGRGHIKSDIPCQDKTFHVHENGVDVIALADGAGSARLSHYGAEFVTKQICDGTNAVEETSDLISNGGFDFLFAMVYALGTGCGYFLVIFIFSTIREKVDHAPVVKGFEGAGIALVTTAILALAITGLAGLF